MDWFAGNSAQAKDFGKPAQTDTVFSSNAGRWQLLTGWFLRQFQLQRGRSILWLAVALSAGLLAYFSLPVEPAVAATAVLVAVAAGLLVAWRLALVGPMGGILAFFLTGFIIGQIGTVATATRVLPASSGKVTVSGWIGGISTGTGSRARLVVDIDEISNVKPQFWPGRVRLSVNVKDVGTLKRGDYVQFAAWLYPPLTPARPGGWNYGRVSWFDGIGAGGRVAGPVGKPGTKPDRSSVYDSASALRASIAARIRASLPKREAGFAIALVTGQRTGLDKAMREALQISGLAHILAISGLHMSLVAGGVFWMVRAILAFWPVIALRFAIKKIAALCGLSAAGFYLLISGQAIATQRAFIMLSVMFVAVLLGRSAISMRNLAVAAIIVLAIAPHAVLTSSFQMSFLAVMGLIAGYELLGGWQTALRRTLTSRSIVVRVSIKVLLGLIALSATTILASAFTALPAAYHFNRFAVWSLPANILAMPVVTTLVMPGAVASVLAMPLGLEHWPLQLMSWGLLAVEAIAVMVAAWPASATAVGSMTPTLAFASVMGLCGLCLWRGALRWGFGAAAVGLGVVAILTGPRPDVLVERSAATMAAKLDDGLLVPVYARRGKFAVERWLLADGDGDGLKRAGQRSGWACKDDVCRGELNGKSILWLGRKGKAPSDCKSADIVVSANPLRRSCGYPKQWQVRIDRFDVWRNGSHAVYLGPDGSILMHTARGLAGTRPWVYTPLARRKVLIKQPPPWKPKQQEGKDQ